MGYNIVIDQTLSVIGYGQQPVTRDDAKNYCRVEASNTAQDGLFDLWIAAAVTYVENATGLSLVPKSCVAILSNPQGNIELPFGPITGTVTWLDKYGYVPAVVTEGTSFQRVPIPFDYAQATYLCGYTNDSIPRELKVAMLNIIASWYENRGDESNAIPVAARLICQKYSRIGILG